METWSYRKARMHPSVSKMELAVLEELLRLGVPCITQHTFCVQATTPDIYLPKHRIAIYLDGEKVHENRVERDEALRELLAKRYGIKVYGFTYKRFNRKTLKEIVSQIKELIEK